MTIRKTHEWQEFMEGYDRCMHCGLLRKEKKVWRAWRYIGELHYYRDDHYSVYAKTFICDSSIVEEANETP